MCICGITVDVQLSEDDDVQLVLSGMALLNRDSSGKLSNSTLLTPAKQKDDPKKKKKKEGG